MSAYSVVIPAYNCENYIEETLRSALGQSAAPFEVIVVDDASTDGTPEIIQRLARKDCRIKYHRNEKNLGVAQARNQGVRLAKSQWIAFLDSDDIWAKQKMQRQLELAAQNGPGIYHTGWDILTQTGEKTGRAVHVAEYVDYECMLCGSQVNTSSVLAPRQALLQFPMEREDLHEDFIEWVRLIAYYGVSRGIDEPLVSYRLTAGSRSRNKLKSAWKTWRSYRYLGLDMGHSIRYFIRYAKHGAVRYYGIKAKKSLREYASHWAKKLANHSMLLNLAFFWNCRVKSLLRYGPACPYQKPTWRLQRQETQASRLQVALIGDEMTYQGLQGVFQQTVLLSPQGWYQEMEGVHPDVLFCESAWTGALQQKECWRWKIYRNHRLGFENRKELRDILKYCREAGIPTIFWNKEDPVYFGEAAHDFADTALWFDHVLTTAKECVARYQALGQRNVSVMQFGYPTQWFYPLDGPFDYSRAVFFGSWYGDQPQRCQDMRRLFDMVLAKGITLEIYDRQCASSNPKHQYPENYRPFVRPGVPYQQIRQTIGRPCYALNINTVRNSETMFARRVLELMACGCLIISNDSPGLRREFGEKIWFLDEPFPIERTEEIRLANLKNVQENHTWHARVAAALQDIRMPQKGNFGEKGRDET